MFMEPHLDDLFGELDGRGDLLFGRPGPRRFRNQGERAKEENPEHEYS
jgi:hypothetical protein